MIVYDEWSGLLNGGPQQPNGCVRDGHNSHPSSVRRTSKRSLTGFGAVFGQRLTRRSWSQLGMRRTIAASISRVVGADTAMRSSRHAQVGKSTARSSADWTTDPQHGTSSQERSTVASSKRRTDDVRCAVAITSGGVAADGHWSWITAMKPGKSADCFAVAATPPLAVSVIIRRVYGRQPIIWRVSRPGRGRS